MADLKGLDLKLVIERVQGFTGKIFMYHDSVVGGKKVNVIAPKIEIPEENALEFLRHILALHGLVLTHFPDKDMDTYHIQVQTVQGPGSGVGFEVVTRVFELKHADVQTVVASLQRLTSGIPNNVMPIGTTRMIMVTDRKWNVEKIAKIIEKIDVPQSEIIPVIYPVVNAPPDQVAHHVQIFMTAHAANAARQGRRQQGQQVSVDFNDHLNAVVVYAPKELQVKIKALIEKLDAKIKSERYTESYKIKNTEVAAIAYMIGELLDTDVAAGFSGGGAAPTAPVGGADGAPSGGGGANLVSAPVRSAKRWEPNNPEAMRLTALFGREIPQVVPDLQQNMLIIRTTQPFHALAEQVIQDLDARRPQVLIEVAIVEITDDDGISIGADLMTLARRGTNNRLFGMTNFGVGAPTFDAVTNLPASRVLAATAGGLGGFTSRDQIPVLLRAIQSKANLNVLSTPLLLVNDNQQAYFQSQEEQSTVRSDQGETTTSTSFSGFEGAGITLTITPLISEADYITLTISQDIAAFVGDPPDGGIPAGRNSTTLQTVVTVPNNETIVIGGLATTSNSETVSQIPILGEIPILGWLFSDRTSTTSLTRIYVFIRPLILDEEDFSDVKGVSKEISDRSGLKIGQTQPWSEQLKFEAIDLSKQQNQE